MGTSQQKKLSPGGKGGGGGGVGGFKDFGGGGGLLEREPRLKVFCIHIDCYNYMLIELFLIGFSSSILVGELLEREPRLNAYFALFSQISSFFWPP